MSWHSTTLDIPAADGSLLMRTSVPGGITSPRLTSTCRPIGKHFARADRKKNKPPFGDEHESRNDMGILVGILLLVIGAIGIKYGITAVLLGLSAVMIGLGFKKD